MREMPTAPVAGGSLISGYAVVAISGSRALGGVALALGGLWCIRTWVRRSGSRTAATLACAGLGAFVLSHLLALAIGAWPAVLATAGALAVLAYARADAPAARPAGHGSP